MRLAIHRTLRTVLLLFIGCWVVVEGAVADDWTAPAQQLARKIVAITGPGAVALTVENRSSLARKPVDSIASALRAELESQGARSAAPEQAAATVTVWLSENPQFYVWVAEIRQGVGEFSRVLVSVPRRDDAGLPGENTPMTLHRSSLWAQEDRILDVTVLEEENLPRQMAVLDGEKVAIYRQKNGKWQTQQSLPITHTRPWPRDLRGRMLPAKDHLLDVYLPGVFCRSTTSLPLELRCRESDDPWPLVAPETAIVSGANGRPQVQPMSAFYSASRNFFTGVLAPGLGKLTAVDKFYSAAALPREKYVLWLFAEVEGPIHLVDGITDQPAKLGWGSDLVSLKTKCGSGWQVLATNGGDNGSDSLMAYEIADRDPTPVTAALDFPGTITALWAEAKGDSAIVITRKETGDYEASRVAVACGQ